MSEAGMRSRVVRMLRSMNAIAVENPVLPGTPDVNYVEGWIELKWLRDWPKRSETIIHLEHFTPQQRVWHLQRRQAGGQSFVLLQSWKEWILLDGAKAALSLGTLTKNELIALSTKYWGHGIDEEEFKKCLSHRLNVFTLTDEDKEKLKRLLQNNMVFPTENT